MTYRCAHRGAHELKKYELKSKKILLKTVTFGGFFIHIYLYDKNNQYFLIEGDIYETKRERIWKIYI